MNYCGVVLMGGASRRMGRDKWNLPVNPMDGGQTILSRTVDIVSRCCSSVFLLVEEDSDETFHRNDANIAVIRDQQSHMGPLSALANAWDHFRDYDGIVVVAADLPGLTDPVLQACCHRFEAMQNPPGVVSTADCFPVVLVRRENRLQPLLGVYHPSAGNIFRELQEVGETRLMRAVETLKVSVIDASHIGWPEWWTRPVHTPEDYEAWTKEVGLVEARSASGTGRGPAARA